MRWQIRTLGPSEWELQRALRLRALRDAPDAYQTTLAEAEARPEEIWQSMAALLANSDRAQFLAVDDRGEPHGSTFVRAEGQKGFIFAMWVNGEVRRQGAGRALVQATIDWHRARGAAEIELAVTAGNTAARCLYEAFGFTFTGAREPMRPDSSLVSLTMRLPLPHVDDISA